MKIMSNKVYLSSPRASGCVKSCFGKLKVSRIVAIILGAAVGAVALAQDANSIIKEAEALWAAKKSDAAIEMLSGAVGDTALAERERIKIASRTAALIHSAPQEAWPLLRTAMERYLASLPLDDAGKLTMLATIKGSYDREKNSKRSLETIDQILALDLPDQRRVSFLSEAARMYIHSVRDLDTGRKYYWQALEIMQREADAIEEPMKRAAKLNNIGYIYQIQTREPEKAKVAYEATIAIYESELPKMAGREKAKTLVSLADAYAAIGEQDKEKAAREQAVETYMEIVERADGLVEEGWIEAVNPREAMRALRQTSAGCKVALRVADKIAEMKGERAKQELNDILTQAVSVCARGPDHRLRSRITYYMEKQLELLGTPQRADHFRLQLGESYFRNNRDRAKAQKIFNEIVVSADASADQKETAQLWLEMLADEGG